MTTFVVPSTPSDSTKTESEEISFNTAEEDNDSLLHIVTDTMAHIVEGMEYESDNGLVPSAGNRSEVSDLRALINRMEERDRQREAQINTIQNNMMSMLSLMQEQLKSKDQTPVPPPSSKPSENLNVESSASENVVSNKNRMEPFKWPEPYDHTDQTKWNATHGLLQYIYKRDVLEGGFLQPSDFFMHLFSHAVTGNAKAIITGQFEDMMRQGRTWDGLGLLQEMDDAFRDKNAEQSAAALLHACKQFKDEALASYLPRFQQLLARSPTSSADDKQKLYQLTNSLNQITQDYLVGRDLPNRYLDLVKFLSFVGSQIERVGRVKTRVYSIGQIGTFDDGTKGIAGGKLLGAGNTVTPYRPSLSIDNSKDADGDTLMTGVNRIRAKWVTKKEIDRRIANGLCIRCGKKGHLINKCHYLSAKRPETGISTAKIEEESIVDNLSVDIESETLKE